MLSLPGLQYLQELGTHSFGDLAVRFIGIVAEIYVFSVFVAEQVQKVNVSVIVFGIFLEWTIRLLGVTQKEQ